MKKIISLMLAVCMIFGCLTVFSYAKTTYKAVFTLKAVANGKNYDSSDTITVAPGETVAVTLRMSNNYKTGPFTALIYYSNSVFDESVPSYEFNKNGEFRKVCGTIVGFTDWSRIHPTYKSDDSYWPKYTNQTTFNNFKSSHYFAKITMVPNSAVSLTPVYAVNEDLITMNFKVSSTAKNGTTGNIIIPVESRRTSSNPGGQLSCGIFTESSVAGDLIPYSDDQVFDCSKAVLNFKVSTGTGAKKGDVNKDTKINSSDALLILQHSVGVITLTSEQKTLADVNNDSKVNSSDALKILQYSVGQITSL